MNLDNEKIADLLTHNHERITGLVEKFGSNYEIVSVNRDRYVRFISAWKHMIDMVDMQYPKNLLKILKNLTIDDILFYQTEDLISDISQVKLIYKFAQKNGFEEYLDNYMINMMRIIIRPLSWWHNNDPKIKWFDFDKLYELEEWVSNKLGKPFKLEKSNSSNHFECNLMLNENFILKYNKIYDYYDLPKKQKTLI